MKVTETKDYKCLEMEKYGFLNLNSHFEKSFKCATGRQKLLAKI